MASEPRSSDGRVYHLSLKKADVGRVAILPGDPGRVPVIARHLANSKKVASYREYLTYAGYVGKERVTVTSTGIGGPSAAIAVEELARLGVEVMVRVGTCGAIQAEAGVGSLVIADSAVRLDGTTRQYVMDGFPAVATPEVVIALREAAERKRLVARVGTAASTDSFYVGQGREGYGGYFPSHDERLVEDLRKARVLCFEMESSTLFTLGRLFGIKTGAVFAVVGNRVTDEFVPGAGVDDAISAAVEAVGRFKELGV